METCGTPPLHNYRCRTRWLPSERSAIPEHDRRLQSLVGAQPRNRNFANARSFDVRKILMTHGPTRARWCMAINRCDEQSAAAGWPRRNRPSCCRGRAFPLYHGRPRRNRTDLPPCNRHVDIACRPCWWTARGWTALDLVVGAVIQSPGTSPVEVHGHAAPGLWTRAIYHSQAQVRAIYCLLASS